jgi:NAD(P)-dependent dehydrogenase (short-subunit alcohol dehydrogenase family)
MDLEITNKVAIVTGGSRGIGRAVAERLASEGADVAIIGRDRGAAQETAQAISAHASQRIAAFQADTGDDQQVAAAVDAIASYFGRIDILVNGASLPGGGFRPLADADAAAILVDLNVKVGGYLRMARQVAPLMQAQGWGRILNIGGIAAHATGSTEGSIRCAAVGALTKNLADELGPKGVTVNAVHPGATRTERSAEIVRGVAEAQSKTIEEVERAFAGTSVLGRFVTPE